MPRTCTVCHHSEREAIDADLVVGTPYRHIATRTGTSTAALVRHRSHITAAVVQAAASRDQEHGVSLLDRVYELQAEAQRLGAKAEREGDLRAALMALRELTRAFELQGRLVGAFQHETAGNQIIVNVVSCTSDGSEHVRRLGLTAGE
jgi:hypothetical protein